VPMKNDPSPVRDDAVTSPEHGLYETIPVNC